MPKLKQSKCSLYAKEMRQGRAFRYIFFGPPAKAEEPKKDAAAIAHAEAILNHIIAHSNHVKAKHANTKPASITSYQYL